MKESQIEWKVHNYIKKNYPKNLFLKVGHDGLPDRLFIYGEDRLAFFEFKTSKGKISPIQKAIYSHFRSIHIPLYVLRSFKEAKELIDAYNDNEE